MRPTRSPRPVLLAFTIAGLVGACSGAQPATRPAPTEPADAGQAAGPRSTMDTASIPRAVLAVGRPGETGLRVVVAGTDEEILRIPFGAPDATWGRIITATRTSTVSTTIRQVAVESEDAVAELRLDGQWQIPTIGLDTVPAGRSTDGSTIVLREDRGEGYATGGTSRFAIVHDDGASTGGRPSDGPLRLLRTIELKGDFEFDTLSPDGSILYLVERLDGGAGGRYVVRSMDVATGVLDETVITDKRFVDEPMAGLAISQLRRADGLVMTLYRGPEHPFIHALDTVDKWAVCIDLPATGADDDAAARDWGVVQDPGGRSVFAINATLGVVAEIDPSELNVRRTARIRPAQSAGAAIVLAKFGHEAGGAVGRRAVMASGSDTLIAGGSDGIVAVRARDLNVLWRTLPDSQIRSLGLTPDGGTAFALLGTGRIVAVGTHDGAILGTVPGDGYDRLVAVMP